MPLFHVGPHPELCGTNPRTLRVKTKQRDFLKEKRQKKNIKNKREISFKKKLGMKHPTPPAFPHSLAPPPSPGGQAYAMGLGTYGQLGLGSNTQFTSSPALLSGPWGNATVTLVAAGSFHSIVVAGVALPRSVPPGTSAVPGTSVVCQAVLKWTFGNGNLPNLKLGNQVKKTN